MKLGFQSTYCNSLKRALSGGLLTLVLTACTNVINMPSSSNRFTSGPTTFPSSTPQLSYKISSIQIGAGGNSTKVMSIFFDPTQSSGAFTTSCLGSQSQTSTNPKACVCNFKWQELNQTTGSTVTLNREITAPVITTQASAATCSLPSLFNSGTGQEIYNGTVLQVTILPDATNSSGFTVPTFTYTVGGGVASGDFQDSQGSSFSNVFRYTCYDLRTKQAPISSLVRSIQDPSGTTTATRNQLYASIFCMGGSSPSADSICPTFDTSQKSSQSYYYNFFVRSTDKGSVNSSSQYMICPRVQEPLKSPMPGGDFYPMDSTFALANNPTSTFYVGVEAYSRVRVDGDPGSSDTACAKSTASGTTTGTPSSVSSQDPRVRSCLGYAARPFADGACPYFRKSDGTLASTYRLRRFLVLYPPIFTSNGRMSELRSDIIYVPDRPVASATADPLKPFTMRGPKPCPFSYFDHEGVLGDPNDLLYPGGMPSYAATNYPGWTGTNVDGIQFPNRDVDGQSCSAALPIINENRSVWTIATLNKRNPIYKKQYVRPIQAWAPHYLEDTDFEACVPLAAPFQDPPLHFARDISTGNVGWCAEVYPSQNTNLSQLDRLQPPANTIYPGKVIPYTSHTLKNAIGTVCNPTSLSNSIANLNGTYPADPSAGGAACRASTQTFTGAAWHPNNLIVDTKNPVAGLCTNGSTLEGSTCYYCANQTCDRTAVNNNGAWAGFPMLARPTQVESAISQDSTFGCVIAWDNGGGKAGKVTPTQGCCGGAVSLWTGLPTGAAASNPNYANSAAHLEPNQACQTPQY